MISKLCSSTRRALKHRCFLTYNGAKPDRKLKMRGGTSPSLATRSTVQYQSQLGESRDCLYPAS